MNISCPTRSRFNLCFLWVPLAITAPRWLIRRETGYIKSRHEFILFKGEEIDASQSWHIDMLERNVKSRFAVRLKGI